MSLQSAVNTHRVTVLEQTTVSGVSMGQQRTYAPANPPRVLACTIRPMSGYRAMKLMQEGFEVPHGLSFGSNPNLDETQRLSWVPPGGKVAVVLRIKTAPYPSAGLGCLWKCLADVRREDQPSVALA